MNHVVCFGIVGCATIALLTATTGWSQESLTSTQQALESVLSTEKSPYDSTVTAKVTSRKLVDGFVGYCQQQMEQGSSAFVTTPLGPALSLANMSGDLLTNLGLKSSDLIVGISGIGIDSPSIRLPMILGVLNRAQVFNLTVLRNKQVTALYYTIQ